MTTSPNTKSALARLVAGAYNEGHQDGERGVVPRDVFEGVPEVAEAYREGYRDGQS